MERALLIEWNPNTGRRAGDVNPRDPKLQCHGWQNKNVEPPIELRLVEDDRDLSKYEGVEGVTVLVGIEAINETIEERFPPRYNVDDPVIYAEHVRAKAGEIAFDSLPDDMQERLKFLKEQHGIKGIRETKPGKVK